MTTNAGQAPSGNGGRSLLRRWGFAIDERLGISALRYPVPRHSNRLAWSLGGTTLGALLILIATGIVLAQVYVPTPEAARASVVHIETGVAAGSLIRGIHIWAAQAMFVLAAAHMARVLITGSYKRPREANWLIGLGLLGLTFLLVFTGSTLRWDQEAFEAVEHNTELAELTGRVGTWFTPEYAPSTPLLSRLYLAHITFLPALIFLLIVIHFFLVRRHKISAEPSIPVGAPEPDVQVPFTIHMRYLAGWVLWLLGILVALAAFTQTPIGAAPVPGVEVTKPLWPFWWLFQLENWIGLTGLFWAPLVVFLLLAALPFLDRSPERRPSRRRWVMAASLVLFGIIAALTVAVAFTSPAAHLE